jgi:nucleoside-diphosphate-sugar epimerase
MRILIAGCGYVGSALARRRVAAGDVVFGLRRRPEGLPAGVVPVAADLCDAAELRVTLPRDLDAVVYATAADGRDPEAYRRAYVEGLSNLLQVVSDGVGTRRVLFTSSTSVYAQDGGAWVDETSPTEPSGFTGRILLEAEALLAPLGGRASVLRLGGIYGPGRARLLEQVRTGQARIPAGPPLYTNRIHRDDAAGALDHLLKLPAVDSVYLGVDDEPADLGTVLRWMAAHLGVAEPEEAPAGPLASTAGPPGRTSKRCRNRRLRASGFVPAYPTFREGYAAILAGGS